MKKTLGLASAVLMTAALTACSDGGDDNSSAPSPSQEASASTPSPDASSSTSPTPTEPSTEPTEPPMSEYCETLKDSRAEFSDLDITTLNEKEFNKLITRFDTLEQQAPAEVADDWATVGGQLDEFNRLLAQAGIGLDDIKTLQKGKLPKGADLAKIQKLGPKLQKLIQDGGLEDAKQAIQDNAETECDLTLGE